MDAFIGAGVVSVAPWSESTPFASLPFRDVGNVAELTIAAEEDRRELRNFRSAAGGTYASAARVNSASLNMLWHDFSPENLALALWGTAGVEGSPGDEEDVIEGLVNAAPLIAIKFDGINTITGKPYVGHFYKCRLGAPQNIGLIGEDFGGMQLAAVMEADTKVSGLGKSQYYQLRIARAAAAGEVTSVTVTPATLSLEEGSASTAVATVLPGGASQAVTWASSDDNIATVSGAGLITAVAAGSATITATSVADGTKSGTLALTVTEA